MQIFGVVAACVGGWTALSIAVALGIGRAIALADRRPRGLRLLAGGKEQHSTVHRIVSLNTAQIPKISVK